MEARQDMLITNATVITLDEQVGIIPDGAILIEDGQVKRVGTTRQLSPEGEGQPALDARGQLVMPGLICAHMHLYSTLARGMALKDEPPANFVQILERLWWRLDRALAEEDIRYSALVALGGCIRHGTTTIIDHHASPGCIPGSLDVIAQAVEQAGLRACLCYEVSDRGGFPQAQAGIEENRRFIARCQRQRVDWLAASFGLHASLTLSDETLRQCVERAEELDVGCHIHVAEDAADVRDARQKYGRTPVQRLADMGVLGHRALAAHCVHVDDDDIDILRRTKAHVVHNPQSNCSNGVGVAPVLEMMARGIPVGLGSDGYTTNMFDEIRAANILHKLAQKDPRVAYAEVPQMALANNRAIAALFFDTPLGIIRPGAAADLIFVDYHPPTPMNADNFWGHLIFGISAAPVRTTMVGGRVLMRDGQVLSIDEQEVAAQARQLAQRLWQRF